MVISNVVSQERSRRFPERGGGDQLKMELLAFCSRNHGRKFQVSVISCALGRRKVYLTSALKEMVEEGIIVAENCNGVLFYSLAASEKRRG